MRPVDKGPTPKTAAGAEVRVSHHRQWRRYLIERIGPYCSYCEIKINNSPQVEHVVAQDIDPSRALDWDNLLLACPPCNRAKSNKACSPNTHYLPEAHNTYLAFGYLKRNSVVQHQPGLFMTPKNPAPPSPQKVDNTIALCALDRDTTKEAETVTDLRWKHRLEAFLKTVIWRKYWDDWGNAKAEEFIALLMTVASEGFFSLWFWVFEDVPKVREALVSHFPGTASNCFDPKVGYIPIYRNPPSEI